MKRKIFSVLFALVLMVTLVLSLPMTASAQGATAWAEYPGNPVFDPVAKAYYPCVVYDGGTYKMWYATATGIAYATSPDGLSWTEVADCTGLKSANHPWVTKTAADKYEIWYWDQGQLYSINAIRHAESSDGISWTNDAAITQDSAQKVITGIHPNWNRGSYGPCSVLFDPTITVVDKTDIMNNRYVMYYDGTTGGDEWIGVAGSLDGKHWVGNPTGLPVLGHAPSPSGPEYVSRCTVLKESGVYRMWFSFGATRVHDGIGYAESTDGILWVEDSNNPIFHKTDGVVWRDSRTYSPSVLKDGSTYKMWFSGKDKETGNYAIGYATAAPPVIEVEIDIKPGSDPNSINLKSKGVVPVAVLATDKFNASTVDPETVKFAGAAPVRWTLEDVDGDTDMDLLLHFKTQDLDLDKNSTEATLTGTTSIGQPIQGTDAVNIVPKGKSKGK